MRKFFGVITLLVGLGFDVFAIVAMIEEAFDGDAVIIGIPIAFIGFIVAFTGMKVVSN